MEISIEYRNLFEAARDAAERAYAPYSHFRVGAAILLEDGSVVTGVNVENRSFGLTNCAERSAIYTAVSAGTKKFVAIVIATPDSDYPVSPCGACRQVLAEFGVPRVILANRSEVLEFSLEELLPRASAGILDRVP